jgi:hypothetical protein
LPADRAALVSSITALGLRLSVRSDGPLAILASSDPAWFPDAALRAELVRVARDAGFTNVAVELPPAPPISRSPE